MCRPLITSTKASFCKQKKEGKRKKKFKHMDADDIKQALGVKKKSKRNPKRERERERGKRGERSGTCGGL